MGLPPSGIVTLLFTDIERSGEQFETRPRQMHAAVARHDAIMWSGIEAQGGWVVKGRLAGDSFVAVFPDAQAAVKAACAIQRALTQEEWPAGITMRVRMGIHTGVAELRDGDYFGDAVNRCNRIMESAHGGQTLVSAVAAEMAMPWLGEGMELVPLGSHQLPGLQQSVDLFQLTHPELPRSFPPLRAEMYPNNLPAQITDFIGRQDELDGLVTALTGRRLVSLVGPGGIGKTRLALEAAGLALTSFPAGVWLVELADTLVATQVPQRVADTLLLRDEPEDDTIDGLVRYLRRGRRLVILDNCEQVLAAASSLATQLLPVCPELHLLATSREALGITGELVVAVPPLPVPAPGAADVKDVRQAEAVRLLEARAGATGLPFAVTEGNAAAVAELVRRLDGSPLAIELAAARLGPLSVVQILERITDRLDLLVASGQPAHQRLSSVFATIQWSHDLLSGAERVVFRRLAVFAGSFDLDAAEAVAANGSVAQLAVAGHIAALARKSLLWVDVAQDGRAPRYRLPETVRTYGLTCLRSEGEEPSVAARHMGYYLSLAEAAVPHLVGPDAVVWLARLDVEFDNLAAAFYWSEMEGNTDTALRLVGAQWRYWHTRGHYRAGLRFAERALALPATDPALGPRRATALHVHGSLCFFLGEFEAARRSLGEALELRRSLGNRLGTAQSLNNLAMVAQMTQDMPTARDMYWESYEIKKDLGDRVGMLNSLLNIANIETVTGRPTEALRVLDTCVATCRELELEPLLARTRLMQIHALSVSGALAAQKELLGVAQELYRALGDALGLAETRRYFGLRELARDDLRAAERQLRASLEQFEETQSRTWVATLRTDLAWLALLRGDVPQATEWLDGAAVKATAVEDHEVRSYRLMVHGLVRCEQGELETACGQLVAALAIQYKGGYRHLALDSLEAFAWLAARAGDGAMATRLAHAAAAENAQSGRTRPPPVVRRLAQVLATAGSPATEGVDAGPETPPLSFEEAVATAFRWAHALRPRS